MNNLAFVSVIIPTIGRVKEVQALLESIKKFIGFKIEIIIVDQNDENILKEVVENYAKFLDISHHRVDFKGASAARNYGSNFASGIFLAFPDDDAEYLNDFITSAYNVLIKENADVVFGRLVDYDMSNSFMPFHKKSGEVNLKNLEYRSCECTLFIKKDIFSEFNFDEKLGVGSFYGSMEGKDQIIRMINEKIKIFYTIDAVMYHPNKVLDRSRINEIKRSYTYSLGFGYCCYKHDEYYKFTLRFIKSILGLLYSLIFKRNNSRYWMASINGLIVGYFVRPV